MKKLFALLLTIVLAFSLAACGGTAPGETGIAIEDVTVDNWQQVIKDNYDINLTLPDGWTVTEAISLGGVHAYFGCHASEEEADAFLESVFSELKRIAAGDITGHYNDVPYDSIANARTGDYAVDAFNLPLSADGSKKMHFSYGKDYGYEESGSLYIESVSIYLS